MKPSIVFVLLTASIVAALALLPASASSAAGSLAATEFTVKSSLAGKSILPHRVQWNAFPSLGNTKIARVEFLVDGGRARWIERNAPYAYADAGWFVTSWLAPGRHRFQVRATAKDGRIATDTVVARVGAPPAPPAALAGTWKRTIDTSSAPKPGSKGNPTSTFTPSGIYRLTFEKRWMRDQFP